MIPTLRPLLKFFRWVRFLDRIQYEYKRLSHKTHEKAALSLIQEKPKQFRERVYDYEGVHPQIVEFWKAMEKACAKRGIEVRAFEFCRSNEKQNEYYEKGVTNARGGESPHNYCCAVDIISLHRAWDLSKKEWEILISIGNEVARRKKIKLTNGASFRGLWDPAHWELTNWRDYRRAFEYCEKKGIELPEDTKLKFLKLDYLLEIGIKP